MAQKLASKQSQAISLKGSTKIVCEFFDFSVVRPPPTVLLSPPVLLACRTADPSAADTSPLSPAREQNNILYQRGIYPTEDFKMVKKYVPPPPSSSI